MTDIIKILSPLITNQIAAGEVIERPASIVKELVENSIDAKSTNIIVTIEKAGNELISVRDNGIGISKNDLPLAFYCHATSKLQDLNDLDTITSLGFRGEALASISAVAKVKITSQHQEAQNAYSLLVDKLSSDSQGIAQHEVLLAAHPKGTTIEVRDLFYSTPVRRRFQKSEKTEYQYILDIFQKLALSNFDCAFTLINDNKVIYKLPGCNKLENAKNNRVKKIFGSSFIKQAVYFSGEAQGIKLEGWSGSSEIHRSQSDQQYFFLNNRIIRDKLILNAIKYAYDGVIPNGRHPCYILYLYINPDQIDINVHPTKHEVRFRDSRWVHQFIVQQLTRILDTFSSNSSYFNQDEINYSNCSNLLNHTQEKKDLVSGVDYKVNTNAAYPQCYSYSKFSIPSDKTTTSLYDYHYKDHEQDIGLCINSRENLNHAINHTIVDTGRVNFGKIIASVSNHLIITRNNNQYNNIYYIIDLETAFGYFSYENLCLQWQEEKKLSSHELAIGFNLKLYSVILNLKSNNYLIEKLLQFGIEIKYNDIENQFKITKIPHALRFACPERAVEVCCEYIQQQILEDSQVNYIALFNKLSELALGRLKNNLLYAEQVSILQRLSTVDSSFRFNNKKLYKILNYEDIQLLLYE